MRLRDYQLFLVDLDDTLYLERDYVLSGLSAVAEALAEAGLSFAAVENWLHRRFLEAGREHIFDLCLEAFDLPYSKNRVDALVAVYRGHEPHLQFLPGAQSVLEQLAQIGSIVIVTDGLPSMQAKKCRALGVSRWVDSIVYCWAEQAPKPDPASVVPVIERYTGAAVLIGDNPGHDLCVAQQLGIDAVRVRQGRFADLASEPWIACLEVDGIRQLIDFI